MILVPSWGLGGGIERYVQGLIAALSTDVNRVEVMSLLYPGQRPSVGRKCYFLLKLGTRSLWFRKHGPEVRIIAAHPGLAIVGIVAGRLARAKQTSAIAYGADVWPGAWKLALAKRLGAQPLAISDYTAGALVKLGAVVLLPPSLERGWFEQLVTLGAARAPRIVELPLRIITVFRLDSAEEKGLRELIEAVRRVRRPGAIELTIAGTGALPPWARDLLGPDGSAFRLVQDPSDDKLARLYAQADVGILCTQLRTKRRQNTGEGFGLALVEAQLAGAAVIGPAAGGSAGAYLEGVTGLRPTREGPEEITRLLLWCLHHRLKVAEMGRTGHKWARTVMEPAQYVERVRRVLLESQNDIS